MTVDDALDLLERRGHAQYGNEPVSQLAHALQTAALAVSEGAEDALVAAALLHDLGHLLAGRTVPPDGQPRDDRHENVGGEVLRRLFPAAVAEPVRLHVAAKRYLCAVDPGYARMLSRESVRSLDRQGGPYTAAQAAAFLSEPFSGPAIGLRRCDDRAKVATLAVPGLSTYRALIRRQRRSAGSAS